MTADEAFDATEDFERMAEDYEATARSLIEQAEHLRRLAKEARNRRERIIQSLVS